MDHILIVDHQKCTGCRLCELACSVKHTGVSNPARSRIHVVKWPLEGFNLPMLCQQCEDAPCIAVCPKGALSRNPTQDLVVLDYDLCIGCKLCVMACPFGGMGIDAATRQVVKCDLCDGDPTCVRFCDSGALQFVPSSTVQLKKKRQAGLKLWQVLKEQT